MEELEEKLQEALKKQLTEFLIGDSDVEIKLTVTVSAKLEGKINK